VGGAEQHVTQAYAAAGAALVTVRPWI